MTEPRKMYDIQNSILKKDFIPTDQEIKTLNSFLMCRWLSSHPYGVEVANYINSHHNLPMETQYWFARSLIHGIKYIGFPKKEKGNVELIEIICKEYKCNINVAKQYIGILPEEETNKLIKKYNSGGRIK